MDVHRHLPRRFGTLVAVTGCVLVLATLIMRTAPQTPSLEVSEQRATAQRWPVAGPVTALQWARQVPQQVATFFHARRWRPPLQLPTGSVDAAQQGVIDYLRAHDRVDPSMELPAAVRPTGCPPPWSRTYDQWVTPACSARDTAEQH